MKAQVQYVSGIEDFPVRNGIVHRLIPADIPGVRAVFVLHLSQVIYTRDGSGRSARLVRSYQEETVIAENPDSYAPVIPFSAHVGGLFEDFRPTNRKRRYAIKVAIKEWLRKMG